jgi:hypothetical protein
MSPRAKHCLILFFTQMVSYCVVCISFIAMAKGRYLLTFIADVGCGLNGYFFDPAHSQSGRRGYGWND